MDENPRIADLRKKLEKDPGSRLFAQLAEELRKEGKFEEAITVAREGLEKIPNYPSARLTLARALLDFGRPAEARPELEQIVKVSPDNILAGRLLGEALETLGDVIAAIKQFEKTLVFAPGDKVIVEKLGALRYKPARPASPPSPRSAPAPSAPPNLPAAFAAAPSHDGLDPTVKLPNGSGAPTTPPSASAPLRPVFDAPVPSAPGAFDPPSSLPGVFDGPATPPALGVQGEVPSMFDAPASAPPSVFEESAALPSVFGAPADTSAAFDGAPAQAPLVPPPTPAPAPAAKPLSTVALDRDLASGTFSPGALNAADLQRHFEAVAAEESAAALPQAPAAAVEYPDVEDTVGFGELQAAADSEPEDVVREAPLPLVATATTQVFALPAEEAATLSPEFPEEEAPVSDSDVGAQTLPLTSMTLADLYLQQGLKAEASAVLSQVMRDEPQNDEARARFAQVAEEKAAQRPEPPIVSPLPPPPPLPPRLEVSAAKSVPATAPPASAPRPATPAAAAPPLAPTPAAPAPVSPPALKSPVPVPVAVPVARPVAPAAPAPALAPRPPSPVAAAAVPVPAVAAAPTAKPAAPPASVAPTAKPDPGPAAKPPTALKDPSRGADPGRAPYAKPFSELPRRSRIRERTIASLKAFQNAAEREAIQQRATELSTR